MLNSVPPTLSPAAHDEDVDDDDNDDDDDDDDDDGHDIE